MAAGRPSKTSRLELLEAAEDLGFEDLSIASLAKLMGLARSTLYGYFATDADLVYAVIDRSWASLIWPEPGDFSNWRDYLEAAIWAIWEHVVARPGLAKAMRAVSRDWSPLLPVRPDMVNGLLGFGLRPVEVLLAIDVLSDMTSQTFMGDRAADSYAPGAAQRERTVELQPSALSLPEPVQATYLRMIDGPPREWFTIKIRVVFDGLAIAIGGPERESD